MNKDYQTSKDYDVLYNLVNSGKWVACFMKNDENPNKTDFGMLRKIIGAYKFIDFAIHFDIFPTVNEFSKWCESFDLEYIPIEKDEPLTKEYIESKGWRCYSCGEINVSFQKKIFDIVFDVTYVEKNNTLSIIKLKTPYKELIYCTCKTKKEFDTIIKALGL